MQGLAGKIAKDESGQTIVLSAAFMATVALGFIALALDTGYLFSQRRQAQSAADAAALAASNEAIAGYPANQQMVANAVAKQNGFDTTAAINPAAVTLSVPSGGNFSGGAYTQATVSKPVATMFLRAFTSNPTLTVAASAIAGGSTSNPTCVCLTGTSGQVLNLSNAAHLNASGCGIVDNSSSANAVGVTGGAVLSGLSLGTVSSNWNNASNINNGGSITPTTKIVTGITNACSPPLPPAPAYAGCVADPGGSYGTFTFGPPGPGGVICYNGLTVGANGSTVTLNPGTYVINSGTLHFSYGSNNRSNLGGNGVFFYLTGSASLLIDNGANVNLVAGGTTEASGATAPTVGSYNGYLIYQTTGDVSPVSLQGGSSTYLNGSLYAPGANLNIANGSGASFSGGLVAKSLTMAGGAAVNAVATTNEGSLSTGSAKLVQ